MEVDRLVAAVASAMAGSNVAAKLVLRCQLVVEEIATNTVHHGGASDVAVSVAISDHIRLDIRDDGAAFASFSAPAQDLSLELSQRSVGGLGLHLIRSGNSVMHYVRYGRFNLTSVEIGL